MSTRRDSDKYHTEEADCLLSFAQRHEAVIGRSALEAVSINPLRTDVYVGFGPRERLIAADSLL
jgi:hypothetical protein